MMTLKLPKMQIPNVSITSLFNKKSANTNTYSADTASLTSTPSLNTKQFSFANSASLVVLPVVHAFVSLPPHSEKGLTKLYTQQQAINNNIRDIRRGEEGSGPYFLADEEFRNDALAKMTAKKYKIQDKIDARVSTQEDIYTLKQDVEKNWAKASTSEKAVAVVTSPVIAPAVAIAFAGGYLAEGLYKGSSAAKKGIKNTYNSASNAYRKYRDNRREINANFADIKAMYKDAKLEERKNKAIERERNKLQAKGYTAEINDVNYETPIYKAAADAFKSFHGIRNLKIGLAGYNGRAPAAPAAPVGSSIPPLPDETHTPHRLSDISEDGDGSAGPDGIAFAMASMGMDSVPPHRASPQVGLTGGRFTESLYDEPRDTQNYSRPLNPEPVPVPGALPIPTPVVTTPAVGNSGYNRDDIQYT
jgi:hypothetical protein